MTAETKTSTPVFLLAAVLLAIACGSSEIDSPGGPRDESVDPADGEDDQLPGTGDEDPLEWPWSDNTGPSDPNALTSSGTTTITTDGAVVENIDLTGLLKIDASDVTVRNFRIRATSHYGLQIESGSRNVLVEDGEILGAGSSNVYVMPGADKVTIRRLWSHDSNSDHLKFEGTNLLVESSFFEKACADGEGHCDGVQSKDGQDAVFRYNTFYFPVPGTPDYPGAPYKCNTPFQIEDSAGGFVVDSNWVNGGNYSFNCKQSGTVSVINNVIGRSYKYGAKAGTCTEWSNNRWEDTGDLVR